MQVFNSNDWRSARETVTLDVEPRQLVEIRVSCSKEVKLFGVSKGSRVLLKAAPEFRLKARFDGFEKLLLVGTGKTEFGFACHSFERLTADQLNHDNPPAPPLPSQGNLLLQFREIMRAELSRTRDAYMDPEQYPGAARYYVDDDDFDFEEELVEKRKAARSQQNPEPPTDPKAAPAVPPVPPTAPEARPQAEAPPQEPKLAAE